jgi:hypothetical protein
MDPWREGRMKAIELLWRLMKEIGFPHDPRDLDKGAGLTVLHHALGHLAFHNYDDKGVFRYGSDSDHLKL